MNMIVNELNEYSLYRSRGVLWLCKQVGNIEFPNVYVIVFLKYFEYEIKSGTVSFLMNLVSLSLSLYKFFS